MSLDPGPDLLNAGVLHLQAGRLAAARRIFQDILDRLPGDPDALHLLGLTAYQGGDFEDAIRRIRQAIERQPGNPAFHSSLGLSLKATGRLDDAVQAFNDALALYPEFSDAHFNLGSVLSLQGRPQDAVRHFAAALKSMPDDVETRFQLARNQESMGDAVAALDGYRRLVDAQPDFIAARFALASMPRDLVGLDEALAHLDAIAAMAPDDGDAHAARAVTLEQAGRLGEARAAAERAVAAAPDRIDPQIAMAAVDLGEGNADAARQRLQRLLDQPMDDSAMAGAGHLLAQALDRLGEPDAAFAAQGESQRLYEREPAASLVDREAFPRMIDDLRQWTRPDRIRGWPNRGPDDGLPTPAFLVGFPRSGTTLVEQVLASHPNLMATGEEQFVFSLVDSLLRGGVGGRTYPASLEDLTEDDVRRLRAVYWQACRDTFGDRALRGRLLDKMPLNIVHLPLIRRLFPDSPIIVALRDPRDVCLSCFMQRFGLNFAMIHFTRIETTARLYAAVMGLWLHYKESMDLSMIEYRYEDLTADFQTTATRLLRFLGEDWDESVREYADTARDSLVATPSYRDVTKPISSRAVGRWRRYEADLAPVLDILSPFVHAFGYDG
jgi:tetratricopeptide (TPR) repeat protein